QRLRRRPNRDRDGVAPAFDEVLETRVVPGVCLVRVFVDEPRLADLAVVEVEDADSVQRDALASALATERLQLEPVGVARDDVVRLERDVLAHGLHELTELRNQFLAAFGVAREFATSS